MLKLNIPSNELWDEKSKTFINIPAVTICLEHSLVSVSKWESKWKKPFLSKETKTEEQLIDYIKDMTITQNVPDYIYNFLPKSALEEIKDYIGDPMTATTFPAEKNENHSSEQLTSELLYYFMVALQIPFECQKWHLNRLITLIKICNIKNQAAQKNDKKNHKKPNMAQRAALNKQRLEKYKTKG